MKKDYKKRIITALIVLGIILRIIYVIYTPISDRQHDLYGDAGHLAYIETIYNTGKLPTTNDWAFYQQPLHHIIAAGWLKINTSLGIDLETAEENIQILTLIYSIIIIITFYKILQELEIKDKYKIIAMLIIAIHPTLIILSGSINNDVLLLMFTCLDILYLIKWYKHPSWKYTITLAFLVAFSALTKISGTIIAVPILSIFIDKFFQDYFKNDDKKATLKNYIIKFGIFGIIAMGLGLSYSIRNMILFDQDLFYVPTPGSLQYCGDKSLFARINIFTSEWKEIYCQILGDCNMIAFSIKSSLFGEYSLGSDSFGNVIAALMLIFNVLIVIISLISMLKVLLGESKKEQNDNKGKRDKNILEMLIIFYFMELVMYVYGNLTMPYSCTMDFRYIVPTMLVGMIFISKNLQNNESKKVKYNIVLTITSIFAILCVIFELVYMKMLY